MRLLLAAAVVSSAWLPLTPVRAQGQRSFEVVSIKKAAPLGGGAVRIGSAYEGDRWTASGVTLPLLIRQAYPDQYSMEGQVLGGPAWSTSERFDIVAKTNGRVPRDELAAMIRSLLRDRFKLETHTETRELNALVITQARSDGRLGPKLRQTTVDCAELRSATKRGDVPVVPPKPGAAMPCGTSMMVGPASWRISSGGMTTGELATMLTKPLGRPVVDRTNLRGFYEVDLEFAREQLGTAGPAGGPDLGPVAASPDVPTVYVALQEQLGLKLESKREQIEVLVIDAVQQPSED